MAISTAIRELEVAVYAWWDFGYREQKRDQASVIDVHGRGLKRLADENERLKRVVAVLLKHCPEAALEVAVTTCGVSEDAVAQSRLQPEDFAKNYLR